MVRDIIQKAAEMRIVDWEGSKGKKSHISGCIGKERRFVHVGGWKCAPFMAHAVLMSTESVVPIAMQSKLQPAWRCVFRSHAVDCRAALIQSIHRQLTYLDCPCPNPTKLNDTR